MNTYLETGHVYLYNARQALHKGDRRAARQWAEKAAAVAPELEEPWLILGGLASPQASVSYLERALKINPQSERARKGMAWAVERLKKYQSTHPDQVVTQPIRPARYSEPITQPKQVQAEVVLSTPQVEAEHPKALARYRWSFLTLLLTAFIIAATLLILPGTSLHALALRYLPAVPSIDFGAPVNLAKPTYTLAYTPTFTPTATFTPTVTSTETPTPTATPIPTDTPWPTDTPEPPPTDAPYTYPDNGGVRWIDIDLTNQRLYAMEGDTVVNSFLISSGVWQFPTVTGQYHIYVKLLSTLMAGDGYYLPDVPYTMYFYKGYGIHGTYWHNNFGTPMSHGCINMYTPDAEWMFYFASVGTLVNIHY